MFVRISTQFHQNDKDILYQTPHIESTALTTIASSTVATEYQNCKNRPFLILQMHITKRFKKPPKHLHKMLRVL